jgi:ribokinase
MTIYNFGSINADYFYQVPHNPAPGETLAATGLDHGLGGKGANQSVAMVQAGADVVHLGAVGRDGEWLERLVSLGVATDAIARLSCTSRSCHYHGGLQMVKMPLRCTQEPIRR